MFYILAEFLVISDDEGGLQRVTYLEELLRTSLFHHQVPGRLDKLTR
jgi:hypothetical protein